MEYSGKLYGKVGNSYFPLLATAQEFDSLVEENKRLKEELQQVKNSCLDGVIASKIGKYNSAIHRYEASAESVSDSRSLQIIDGALNMLREIKKDLKDIQSKL